MNFKIKVLLLFVIMSLSGFAQQFNSDNYLTMPHGTATMVLTTGQRSSTFLCSFAFVPKFEFFAQANLFRDYRIENYPQHFNTSVYAKYMFWVNKKKNGGAAVFLGFGRSPGYYQTTDYTELNKNVWTAFPVTIPFAKSAVLWDVMPGALLNINSSNHSDFSWGFTWSSRLAIYKIVPQTAIVAEIYGAEGQASTPSEYKVGLRWEPNDYIVPALSYSSSLDGGYGAGIEIGIIIFTPQYLSKSFIKNNHINYNE